jgi:hypothetical protein
LISAKVVLEAAKSFYLKKYGKESARFSGESFEVIKQIESIKTYKTEVSLTVDFIFI